MNTDIKKAVFQVIVGSEDCVQAFELITKLALKKVQEREVIRVLCSCLISEKTFNPYYYLLA